MSLTEQTLGCVIIGASHAGVNLAFALRKEGFSEVITLIDSDETLPYHRPPLSKAYLTSDDAIEKNALKSAESYQKSDINLTLGWRVSAIDKVAKTLEITRDGETKSVAYSQLVFATGARPFIPPITGIEQARHLYPLRTAQDVSNIKSAITAKNNPKVVVIGGGYIGLETAASLKKMGALVTVLERESRLLARVTSPFMSDYFDQLHRDNGVNIQCNKNVEAIAVEDGINRVTCDDGTSFDADIIIVGVGIRVNSELAATLGLTIENGIKVDEFGETSQSGVYAIGDCSFHHNPHYDRYIRLESVQNAVDQAKCVAKTITGKAQKYDTIPWFWSDQYDVKLQMVGLSQGYDDYVVRQEDSGKFSVWYFAQEQLLAVDAVNNAKAYVLGTKAIKSKLLIDKVALADPTTDLPK